MERLIDDLLDGSGNMNTIKLIEKTAKTVSSSSLCRRRMIDDAINIRGLKLYAIDHAGHVQVYR